jgi:hypothetical protein
MGAMHHISVYTCALRHGLLKGWLYCIGCPPRTRRRFHFHCRQGAVQELLVALSHLHSSSWAFVFMFGVCKLLNTILPSSGAGTPNT